MANLAEHPHHSAHAALAGRDRELASLRDRLAAALDGRGGLVLIGGEAGIGKTALAEALLTEATAEGALVLVGRCYDLSETPPYGPWAEALARAPGGDLPAPPDLAAGGGVASQAALFAAVRDYLVALAARCPLALLLDDLHWADPASLDLLRVLGRDLAGLPLLLLATYRSDELTRRHPLSQLLPLLVREARAVRLDPRPLDAAGLRALVRGRYTLPDAEEGRLIAYLAGYAEGNPLFTGELLRALEERGGLLQRPGGDWTLGDLPVSGVPPLLRQVIDARVDRLGEEAGRLLAIAAVIGSVVPLDLWAAVADGPEAVLLEVIERAVEAHVLTEAPAEGGYRFTHALIRGALYEGLALPRRRAWHRRAGEILAASPAPDPSRVAHHFRRAGDARAAEWLIKAGERAGRAYAWLTAAERYEAALALLGAGGDPGRRAALLAALAQFRRYDDPRRGVAYLEEARRLAEEAGDDALALSCRFDQGHLRCLSGEAALGLGEMLATLPALEALPAADRARLPTLRLLRVAQSEHHHRGALVIQLANVGRLAEAQAIGASIAARGPGTTGRGLLGLGLAHACLGQPELARRMYGDARALFRSRDEFVEVRNSLNYELDTVAWPYYADQPAVWEPLAAEADAIAPRVGGAEPHLHRVSACLRIMRGDWPPATGPGPGHLSPSESWPALLVARYRGDASAWAAIAAELPQGPATPPGNPFLFAMLPVQQVAVALALNAGDVPLARAWLGMQDRWLAWSGAVLGRAENQLGWAACHRAAGDLPAAREYAARALDHASEPRQPPALLAAHRLLGELDTDVGHYTDAAAHFDAALALADACAAPYERALTLLAQAELCAATGDRDAARALLEEARAILAPLEARPALARAEALAARLTTTAATVTTLPAGLSAREAEVLRLVARGLTNAQVAERLFLSPRTIDQHLRSIYGKIGVDNRTAATRFATEHGLA